MAELAELTGTEVWGIAARMPGDALALTLVLQSHGVGWDAFKLPTEHLARLNFLPGWSRQNYRTAIANALAMGLMERAGPATPGRGGALYRLPRKNRLVGGPPLRRAG